MENKKKMSGHVIFYIIKPMRMTGMTGMINEPMSIIRLEF